MTRQSEIVKSIISRTAQEWGCASTSMTSAWQAGRPSFARISMSKSNAAIADKKGSGSDEPR